MKRIFEYIDDPYSVYAATYGPRGKAAVYFEMEDSDIGLVCVPMPAKDALALGRALVSACEPLVGDNDA